MAIMTWRHHIRFLGPAFMVERYIVQPVRTRVGVDQLTEVISPELLV